MRACLSVSFATLFATFAALGDTTHAMGFRPSSRIGAARRVTDSRPSNRLRASAKGALPERWDSREKGWISPVKNQGSVGACWSFASYATLETQLLIAGKGEWDFSEKNMVNLHGWLGYGPDDGGNYNMAAGYLLRWAGAVAETNDVYVMTTNDWTGSPMLAPIVHVQNAVWTEPLDGTDERIASLKEAIMKYGAVAVSMYYSSFYAKKTTDGSTPTLSYYCPSSPDANHAVTIIGWDDTFETNKFCSPPPRAGAWIVKNSWGTANYGDGGCFRVSYCDAVFGRYGSGCVFVPAVDEEDYDVVRGYDVQGPIFDASGSGSYIKSKHNLQASVFTAAWDERLDAVGVWSGIFPNICEILIYTNVTRGAATPVCGGALACRQTNTLERAGFTTIHLDEPVTLAPWTSFAVVYHQTGEEISNLVNCNLPDCFTPDHNKGNCYFGYFGEEGGIEGATWFDGKTIVSDDKENIDPLDVSWATTIKAYTRMTVPARDTDAPCEADDGTAYVAALAETNPTLYAETARTFGASIGLVGVNGRSLWASYLAGLDPADPDSCELEVSISVTNNVPYISWKPDLGDKRKYTLYGTESLSLTNWQPVDDLMTTSAKFFKVSVGQW